MGRIKRLIIDYNALLVKAQQLIKTDTVYLLTTVTNRDRVPL